MIIKRENIRSVEFALENCECIVVPIECFKSLNIVDNNINIENCCTLNKFECEITYKEGLDYSFGFKTNITPLQRLDNYSDIVNIIINLKDGQEIECAMPWYENEKFYDSQYNANQKTIMKSHKELYIKIEKNSKEYTIQEIFKLSNGTKFIDENNKEYTLYKDNKLSCIPDMMITEKLLNAKFKLIN